MRRSLLVVALSLVCVIPPICAQEVRPPSAAVAGSEVSIATTGSEKATFYLIGPGTSVKRDVQMGQEVKLQPQEMHHSGWYVAIVCADSCTSATFYVSPAKAASLTFLVHPSRAPVAQGDVISGVALPFDEFENLITQPAKIGFHMSAGEKTLMSQSAETHSGVAWFRTNSGKAAGAVQVFATLEDVSARRVVQQVASDPCSLHIKGQRTPKGIVVETEPVRDCTGNPVPDGTIVTFTAKDGKDTSTVDAPIKQGIARAQITAEGPVVVSAASGVVMGNELRLGAQ